MYILAEKRGGEANDIALQSRDYIMKPERKKAVANAVSMLVESKDYKALKAQLLRMIDQHAVLPTKFAGDLEVLNSLVELGVEHPLQFEQVFGIITARRRERLMFYQEQRRSTRNDYMKKYMRLYRAKQRGEPVKTAPKKRTTKAPKGANDQEILKILGD